VADDAAIEVVEIEVGVELVAAFRAHQGQRGEARRNDGNNIQNHPPGLLPRFAEVNHTRATGAGEFQPCADVSARTSRISWLSDLDNPGGEKFFTPLRPSSRDEFCLGTLLTPASRLHRRSLRLSKARCSPGSMKMTNACGLENASGGSTEGCHRASSRCGSR